MAASNNKTTTNSAESRRTFLKIGGGVVVGAAVASIVEIPYYSNANNANASKVTSLQSQLEAANSNLNTVTGKYTTTQSALTAANANVTTLTSKLNTANTSLSTANTQVTTLTNNLAASQTSLTSTQSQLTAAQTMTKQLQAASTTLQTQIDTTIGFLCLSSSEQVLLAAVAETIIPSDSSGPGAKEAGAIYFIDRVLSGDYGKNGNMYMQGPFAPSGMAGPLVIGGITYPDGSPVQRVTASTRYQYAMSIREFFRFGLEALESYASSAYGGNFESLSAANQMTCLQDLWNGKPKSFNDINPVDFAYELTMLVWCGFLMDPIYGGNQNMVGWTYTGFNGVNQGNFYGEGMTTKELMVATTPTRLQPASLAQFQKGSP